MLCEEFKFYFMNVIIKLVIEGCIVWEVLLIRMWIVVDCLFLVIIRIFIWFFFIGMVIIELNDWIYGCVY